jgi:hypothetical protein
MEIVKVIVDKLPESCWNCQYYSIGTRKGLEVLPNVCDVWDKAVEDCNIRPDWCPLVTEAQNIDEVLEMCYEMGGGE